MTHTEYKKKRGVAMNMTTPTTGIFRSYLTGVAGAAAPAFARGTDASRWYMKLKEMVVSEQNRSETAKNVSTTAPGGDDLFTPGLTFGALLGLPAYWRLGQREQATGWLS